MAGSFNDYLENKLLDYVFRNVSYTAPTTVYVALYTVTPNDAGGGTEVTGGSYARTAVTFAASSGGSITNSGSAVTFPTATADWAAGGTQIVAFAILDAASNGNFLCWGSLTTARNVLNGDTAKFNTSGLTVTLD